jgi:hypothetical protein
MRLLLLTGLTALLIALILLSSIRRFVVHIVPFRLIGHYDISCCQRRIRSSLTPPTPTEKRTTDEWLPGFETSGAILFSIR